MSTAVKGIDGKLRCSWCEAAPEFDHYHDTEWGFPVRDDYRLFEKICLEGFQSGLSWRTILNKRENFRAAFHHFDFNKIATFTQPDVNRLLKNESIIRHRGKIEATINNAKCAQKMVKEEGSLSSFFWSFEPSVEPNRKPQTVSTSPESVALSKALKKRGWRFVGPTMGLINDHVEGCFIRLEVERARGNR